MGDIGLGTRNDMQAGAYCRMTLEEGLTRLEEKTWKERESSVGERGLIR